MMTLIIESLLFLCQLDITMFCFTCDYVFLSLNIFEGKFLNMASEPLNPCIWAKFKILKQCRPCVTTCVCALPNNNKKAFCLNFGAGYMDSFVTI